MGSSERTFGRFRIQERLGAGGFGTVFRALDPELNRAVALKIPHLRRLTDDCDRQRFVREAQHLAQVRHPGIVPVYEAGHEDGVPYLVTELIAGQTLAHQLQRRQPSPDEAASLCADIAGALHHAHEAGIIHRDVKPGNIMVDGDGRAYLMDFGLAKWELAEISMSVTGEVLGTPSYMSPEQAAGDRVGRTSDVYGLGVVLYELLTRERPFRGNTHMVIQQVLNEEPRPPRTLNHHVPRDLEMVCLKAMAKEPRRRYASAKELADDLRRFVRREPVGARPIGLLPRFSLWCRRPERIREASTITVAMSLMMALWETQGAVFILSGLLPVPDATKALLAPVGGAVFFLLLAGLGWLARMRTLAALWIGAASTAGLFAFAITCMFGVIQIEGLAPPAVRLPVFGFFSIAAGIVIASHAVSLVAFYSNRSAIRWSRQAPLSAVGGSRAT